MPSSESPSAVKAQTSSSFEAMKSRLEMLPNEIKLHIFLDLGDEDAVKSLSQCSRELAAAYRSNKGLIIYHILESNIGPECMRLASAWLAASQAELGSKLADFGRLYLSTVSTAQAISKVAWTAKSSSQVFSHFKNVHAWARALESQYQRFIDRSVPMTKEEQFRLMRCLYIMEILTVLLPLRFLRDTRPGSPLDLFWTQMLPWEHESVKWCISCIADMVLFAVDRSQLPQRTLLCVERIFDATRIDEEDIGESWMIEELRDEFHAPAIYTLSQEGRYFLQPSGPHSTLCTNDVQKLLAKIGQNELGPSTLWFLQILHRNRGTWALQSAGYRIPSNMKAVDNWPPIWDVERLRHEIDGDLVTIQQMMEAAISAGVRFGEA